LEPQYLIFLQSFRNDDSSSTLSDASLHFPIFAFMDQEAALQLLSPDATISIPYVTLYTFLEHVESSQQKVTRPGRLGRMKKLLPGTELMKYPRTLKEQLEDSDEARFAASEDKAERIAHEDIRKLRGENIVVCILAGGWLFL
jgi:hypothetical protein